MPTQAPFNFHCVICIEAFNQTDRPPVILPCGHTYICEPCSKRIKRCMECRTSLFVKLPESSSSSSEGDSFYSNYNSYHTEQRNSRRTLYNRRGQPQFGNESNKPKPPPVQQEQIPLPLPKNLVLLELMEAAENREKAQRSLADNDGDLSEHSIQESDEDVLDSIDVLSGTFGTYIVRERYGLPVYECASDKHCNEKNSDGHNGERRHHGNFTQSSSPSKPLRVLVFGQRVQIVDVSNDGVFRLARNEGVIYATNFQLVKVGTAKEASCKLEGMVNFIQSSRAQLTQKLEGLSQAEKNLRSQLEKSLAAPVDHPIIEECSNEHESEDQSNNVSPRGIDQSNNVSPRGIDQMNKTFLNLDVFRRSERNGVSTPKLIDQQIILSPSDIEVSTRESILMSVDPNVIASPSQLTSEGEASCCATPTPVTPPTLATPRSKKIILFDQGTPNSALSDQSPMRDSGLICGGSLMPLFRLDDEHDLTNNGHGSQDSESLPIRRLNSDDYGGSGKLEGVNWRTGFSGHSALNKGRKSKNLRDLTRGAVRFMGEHRGIAHIKKIYKGSPSSPGLRDDRSM